MRKVLEFLERLGIVVFVLFLFMYTIGSLISLGKEKKLAAILKAEKADYNEDYYTTELNHELNKLATDLDLFVYTIKNTDNYIFDENDFKDFEMYSDFVIYGDDVYTNANDLEYKRRYVSLMIGVINYHMDDINTFIYSLGINRYYYDFLWKDVQEDIRNINDIITEYNKVSEYDMTYVNGMKDINRKTIKAGKAKWKEIEGAKYPQGSRK